MAMSISTATAESDAKLTIVNPPNMFDPTPNGYSTAVIVPSQGRIAYISGQGGQDSTGGLSSDFATQVKQAYANLAAALEGLGARPDQVAKLTTYVVDHDMGKLDVLTRARDFGLVTKSNLILGMGETREEVSQALRDLHGAGCELVTITQYLRPSVRHHPVERWVRPEEFVELAAEAEEIGFAGVLSGPLVRSSYRAGRLYRQAMDARAGASA